MIATSTVVMFGLMYLNASRRPTKKGNPAINFTLAGRHLFKRGSLIALCLCFAATLFLAVLRHIHTVLRAVAA